MFESLRPINAVSSTLGGPSLESYLLARHRAIDALLDKAIDEHGVTQVIEVAAGLSPRGWRFTQRYGDRLTYIEADLPGMAARKRRALAAMGSLNDRHRVTEVDALRDRGPDSICRRSPTSSIANRGWRSSPRACSATSTPTRSTGSGAASRGRCRDSPPAATSPTCIWAPCRTRRYARFALRSRCSCAVRSTCISTTPSRRRGRCGTRVLPGRSCTARPTCRAPSRRATAEHGLRIYLRHQPGDLSNSLQRSSLPLGLLREPGPAGARVAL